ncbi:hypothetical protein QQF64_028306, partial [Cirrhinus molitorella]
MEQRNLSAGTVNNARRLFTRQRWSRGTPSSLLLLTKTNVKRERFLILDQHSGSADLHSSRCLDLKLRSRSWQAGRRESRVPGSFEPYEEGEFENWRKERFDEKDQNKYVRHLAICTRGIPKGLISQPWMRERELQRVGRRLLLLGICLLSLWGQLSLASTHRSHI